MLVVDASALSNALLLPGAAREKLAAGDLHAPHLVDSEVTSALRGLALGHRLSLTDAQAALDGLLSADLVRHAAVPLTRRVWELRANLTAYDACYVALAERLGCPLVTADARIARAPALRCAVEVVG